MKSNARQLHKDPLLTKLVYFTPLRRSKLIL